MSCAITKFRSKSPLDTKHSCSLSESIERCTADLKNYKNPHLQPQEKVLCHHQIHSSLQTGITSYQQSSQRRLASGPSKIEPTSETLPETSHTREDDPSPHTSHATTAARPGYLPHPQEQTTPNPSNKDNNSPQQASTFHHIDLRSQITASIAPDRQSVKRQGPANIQASASKHFTATMSQQPSSSQLSGRKRPRADSDEDRPAGEEKKVTTEEDVNAREMQSMKRLREDVEENGYAIIDLDHEQGDIDVLLRVLKALPREGKFSEKVFVRFFNGRDSHSRGLASVFFIQMASHFDDWVE